MTGISSWTGRNGAKNRYWHGDHHSSHTGCQCREKQNCNRSYGVFENQCNCDNDVDANAVDIGILSSLTKEKFYLLLNKNIILKLLNNNFV